MSVPSARTRSASGRFAWLLACALTAGCAGAGPDPEPGPAAPEARAPLVREAPISGLRQADAARLYEEAREALALGDAEVARELAEEVVTEYPESTVSGEALWLSARAALEAGDAAAADTLAADYLELPGALEWRAPEPAAVRILRAEAVADRPEAVLERLLPIAPDAPDELIVRAREMARAAAEEVDQGELERLFEGTPPDAPVRPVVGARLAGLFLFDGDSARAGEVARETLATGAAGPDSALAAGVVRGELPDDFSAVTTLQIGVVLPLGGAPALASFAEQVLEGVEVAAATALGPRYEVRVSTRADQGDPDRTAEVVRELEQEGVGGIVGFLQDFDLEIAAAARRTDLPLVSPTARVLALGEEGVYTLEGVDPEGVRALARYAAERGYQRVAIIHPDAPLARVEATTFEQAAAGFGISTVARLTYAEGATFFEPQIIAARDSLRAAELAALGLADSDTLRVELLDPVALVLPIPPEDVELVAPQVVHFGLDTLGIDVLGTTGWADAQTLSRIDARHTDGVVALAPVGTVTSDSAYERFRDAYEEHFQRSLVSSVPAFGYDATLVLLEALRRGRSNPDAVREALASMQEVEGATGAFSVTDGRIYRRTRLVEIRNRQLVPIAP